jgi:hypothetical protein
MANKIQEAVLTFLPTALEPDIDIAPTMTGSDHAPFWDVGWPATCGIEEQAWGPDFNPYYHSVNDLVVNCDLTYATNCTKAAIAALADYAVPIVSSGPYVAIDSTIIDDVTGNQNGAPDPGETISILVYLINVGSQTATGISATLTTTSPYLTITQNGATYPDLNPQQSGVGSQPYLLDISATCPQGTWVSTTLNITAAGGYQNATPISFIVGNPIYDPTGPDAYGYYAYDIYDENGPIYNWIEIDPFAGGPGTVLATAVDDTTFHLNLPFTFVYYGQSYTQISVCANGWIAMGSTTDVDWSNSAIPNSDGPPAMIAPFWEDLSPQLAGRICYYSNVADHTYIIEYNGVRQYSPSSATETFEVVLCDPEYYQTPTGDAKILMQYKRVSDPTSCTMGIENPSESIGLQYLFNTDYDEHGAPLDSAMAIMFMTATGYPNVNITLIPYGMPIIIPALGGSFDFNIGATNNESTSQSFQVWCNVTLPGGTVYGPVLGPADITLGAGASLNRDRTQIVPASAPAGDYTYNAYVGAYPSAIWSSDSFAFTKLGSGIQGSGFGEWINTGEPFAPETAAGATPNEFALEKAHPNPFNPTTAISFQLSADSYVSLRIYDVAGRLVATLADGWRGAGSHELTFEGSGLASGIYLVKLEVGGAQAVQKMVLMK